MNHSSDPALYTVLLLTLLAPSFSSIDQGHNQYTNKYGNTVLAAKSDTKEHFKQCDSTFFQGRVVNPRVVNLSAYQQGRYRRVATFIIGLQNLKMS